MAKGIDEKIESLNTPWEGYKGGRIEEFIKNQIASIYEIIGRKVGYMAYEEGAIKFYDEEGGSILGSFALGGTVYSVLLTSSVPSSFYVLKDDTEKYVDVTPSSKSGTIGGEMSPFNEDYTWSLYIDAGTGSFVEKEGGRCVDGGTVRVNVRDYLTVGSNRVKFTFVGDESRQSKSITLTANVTTLTLTCNLTWQVPWIEGGAYYINNIYFSGNMQKTLNVKIDENSYTQVFASGSNYTTSAYMFDVTNHFPGTTGVHTVEIWMTGNGVTTEHYLYNIMCVAAADTTTANLVCLNNITNPVLNYETQALFGYALYGTNTAVINITATDGVNNFIISDNEVQTNETQTKIQYIKRLEMESVINEGFNMTINVSAGTFTQSVNVVVDNSNSYAPVTGEDFYLNAANRSNATSNREIIINAANNASVPQYSATWNNFSWETDGWYIDNGVNKCLCINAGSSVTIPEFNPIPVSDTKSLTIEFKYKCSNIADYNTPVLSFMSTDNYDADNTNGLILFPTKIQLLSTSNKELTPQSVNLTEDSILHIIVVFQRLYKNTGKNLCRIYVNGIQQAVFEYAGTGSFEGGMLRMGQASADFYLYMMRVYEDKVFEDNNVLTNFLNCIVDSDEYNRNGVKEDNNITDAGEIDYFLTKRAGYNTMVIEMANDVDIPSLVNSAGGMSTLKLEYADYPSWNVTIQNAPIDGQGTTSMRYYRWNLRWKLKDAALFTYSDGTTNTKKGYIAGIGLHPKCSRIVAKKNVASSMQGHKMGATNMYDELYKAVGLKTSLPSDSTRVAVYQYPFFGFQKFADNTYKFIGLYTCGPDKGDKGTFGYDTDEYPSLLSLEGPNHNPLGTRFLHPWTEDTQYDYNQETLCFGGEEGWDVDVCAYETDSEDDALNIQNLLNQEWKPAYDIVYYNSPFIRSLTDIGMTLSEINADVASFRTRTDMLDGKKNDCLQLYDDSYNLIYYRTLTGQYEVLNSWNVVEYNNGNYVSRTCVNILDYLGGYLSTQNPTTEQIIAARKAKFKAEAQYYWSINGTVFHEAYLELIGGSDNHAKNSYPFKFKLLSEGGRWSWRQDDLDTVMATDNNGQSTKDYGIEVGDVTSEGIDIFQGSSSNLWALLCDEDVFYPQISAMMRTIIEALVTLSNSYGIGGNNVHERVYNMFAHYFWNNSAKYFPIMGYAKDAVFSYIDVWEKDTAAVYNNVPPLRQALGTQLEAEKQWVKRRIANICSKYSIGGFNGSSDDGYGRLEFTPAATFIFNIIPAIEMYPTGNIGGGNNVKGARTKAGEVCQITATSDGTTTFYIKGLDWYTSLGDLSQLTLTTRGGDSTVGSTFSVSAKRLRSIKIGDEVAENVLFNAGTFNISGDCLEEIDARNVVSIRNTVDLQGCPRLRKALFSGSSAPLVILPIGSKVSQVSMPSTMTTMFLHSLPMLTEENFSIPAAAYLTITGYYFNNCPNIDPFAKLRLMMNTPGNRLRYVTIICEQELSGNSKDVDLLAALATDYGSVVYNSENNTINNSDSKPNLQFTLNIDGCIYQDSKEAINAIFPDVIINATGYYIRFEDNAAMEICAINWGDYIENVITEVVSDDSEEVDITTVSTPISMLNTTATRGDSVVTESVRVKTAEDVAGTTTRTEKVAVGITYEQAAAVTTIGVLFKDKNISKFNELIYFTSLTSLSSWCFSSYDNPNSLIEIRELPNNITNINDGGLAGLFGSIILPPNLRTMHNYPIGNRVSVHITKMVFKNKVPSTGSSLAGFSGKEIYVPSNSLNSYWTADNWSSLKKYIRPFIEGNSIINKEGTFVYQVNSGIDYVTDVFWDVSSNPFITHSVTTDGRLLITANDLSEDVDSSFDITCTFILNGSEIVDIRTIHINQIDIIEFEDPVVKELCVNNWGGSYGGNLGILGVEGEITKEQAAAVTSLGTVFMSNKEITTFNELVYFTNVKTLASGSGGSFNSCTSLRSINLENITTIRGNTGTTGNTSSPLNYTALTELYIPNLVTVSQYAFRNGGTATGQIGSLRRITIGENFTTIESQYSFAYANSVSIKILATTPPTGSTLVRSGFGERYFYVPDESYDAYLESPVFANWVNYIRKISECEW